MGLTATRHKIAFLEERASAALVTRLTRGFALSRQSLRLTATYPPAALDALEVDLLYCLIRHRPWVYATIFPDVVSEFVQREYGLPRGEAEQVSGDLLHEMRKFCPKEQRLRVSDRDFLKYVFVSAAAAKDEESLVADLGLGVSLLRRLREAAESLVGTRSSALSACFVPEIDALFSDIMVEVSTETAQIPWITDVHRLRYHLLETPEPMATFLEQYGAKPLFEVLLRLGRAGSAEVSRITGWLHKEFPGWSGQGDEETSVWLAILKERDLVFREGSRWRLSQMAQEFTADAFARRVAGSAVASAKKWRKRPAPYQIATIKNQLDDQAPVLFALASSNPEALSPAALEFLLVQLIPKVGDRQILQFALELSRASANAWIRRAACRALGHLTTLAPCAGAARQSLYELAESDPSPGVRETAFQALCEGPDEMLHRDVRLLLAEDLAHP